MKRLSYLIILGLFTISCNSKIKDSETKIKIEKGTEIIKEKTTTESKKTPPVIKENSNEGAWVGYFKEDTKGNHSKKSISVDEGFYWNRDNKINISIDQITDSIVIGHSVVAGNDRPFSGKIKKGIFKVKEPGDDKYDGEFIFKISGNKLIGKWTAYKNIDIKNREYELEKKAYVYNRDIMLEEVNEYIDWNKFTEKKIVEEYDEGQFEEWISKEFATASQLIYHINASNTILKKNDVENLKKGDLTIIRNTIYARHGYSFKNRPLRVFFDAQDWYIPVHSDIKSEFTEIEKENIKLLLRYEKNAIEYYDHFGRG